MLEFFEKNDISPDQTTCSNLQTLETSIKKRINGVIAILKNIEKHQTKPTVAMLHLLFEESEPVNKPLILEKNNFRADKEALSSELYIKAKT